MTQKKKVGGDKQRITKKKSNQAEPLHNKGGDKGGDKQRITKKPDISAFRTAGSLLPTKPTANESEKVGGDRGDKGGDKAIKKGWFSVGIVETLTTTEKEILHSHTKEGKTFKQIAAIRKINIKNVYYHIKNIKKKGFLGIVSQGGDKEGVLVTPPTTSRLPTNSKPNTARLSTVPKLIRLHGQQWKIDLFHNGTDERYQAKIGTSILINGNTVRCNKSSIEIYGAEGLSFPGHTTQEATDKAWAYWLNQFAIIENDLKIMLVKDRAQNIHLVKAHYAQMDNELATETRLRGDSIQLRAPEDGKVWFIIDNSFDMDEAECVHSKTSNQDSKAVFDKQLQDWRKNNPPTLSEVMGILGDMANKMHESQNINTETAAGLNAVASYLKAILPKLETKPPAPSSDTTPSPQQQEKQQETKHPYDPMEGYC